MPSCYSPTFPEAESWLSGEPGQGAGTFAGFEDELGLGLSDDTVHGDVLQDEVAQSFGAFNGHVEVEVLHSAAKYLGGHGDVMGGVVACADQATAATLRQVRAITGALLHPLGAYLLHRGLATLPVRVRRQQESARQVAGWLATSWWRPCITQASTATPVACSGARCMARGR
jgi:Cys/Met metabolism PLP-dependent enzyme